MLQLTGLDAAFLAMETATTYGHVGSVAVLDAGSAKEPVTVERLTALIESRLHLLPPFRRRLVEVPLGLDQPYWVEDPGFDIEFHVRELALPAPGDDDQLAEQVARLHARPLDRSRPMWELYLVHGLDGGRSRHLMRQPRAARRASEGIAEGRSALLGREEEVPRSRFRCGWLVVLLRRPLTIMRSPVGEWCIDPRRCFFDCRDSRSRGGVLGERLRQRRDRSRASPHFGDGRGLKAPEPP
jgi:WS/DGAT/MGAT family acyltransferase